MPDVSIAISARDNFSDAITTMRNANQAFDKDLTGTMEKLNSLNQNKIALKVDTEKARADLKEAEKQFAATGSAADKMAMELANDNYENARRNLDLVSKNARQAEKDILSMTDAVEKSDNRASRAEESPVQTQGILSRLSGAGLKKMAGDALSNVAQTYLGSALNDETGSAIGSVMSGITSGAAIGSVIPGVGTAIGAAVGAAAGGINAAVKVFNDQDSSFKGVVQDQYNQIQQEESDMLSQGTESAATKEGDLRAFTTLLRGNAKAATDFQKSLVEISRTKLSYDTVAGLSKEMLGLGDNTAEVQKKMNDLNEASTALDWSDSTISSVTSLLDSALESGTINSRVLKTLSKNGVNAYDAIAQAFHIKQSDVNDKVGKLDPESVINAIYNYMGSKFAGSVNSFQNSYEGLKKRAESYENGLSTAMGQGHNEEVKKGYAEEIKTMSGSTGSALKEAYSMEGKFQAQLENSQKELLNNAYTSVTSGKVTEGFSTDHTKELQQLASDYQKQMALASKGNQAAEEEAARDIEKAKIIAQNEYKSTEGYKLELQSDLALADSIRDDAALNGDYYQTGYTMGQKFSQGVASGWADNAENALGTKGLNKSAANGGSLITGTVKGAGGSRGNPPAVDQYRGYRPWMQSKAVGTNRVPYNNFPAMLHEGEQVLTAVEARSQGPKQSVLVTGNTFNVRQESDIDAIASALAEKLERARQVTP